MTREDQDSTHDVFPLPYGEFYPHHSASKTNSCEVVLCREGNFPSVTGASRNARVQDVCNYLIPLWITGRVFQTSLTIPPPTDERTPAMYAPGVRSPFRGPVGGAASRETSVCMRRGASWRQYRVSRLRGPENPRDKKIPSRTKSSLVNFPQSPKCFGRRKQPLSWLTSPRQTSAPPSGGYAANMNRPYRSSWPSFTKCCANRRSLTSVKEAA